MAVQTVSYGTPLVFNPSTGNAVFDPTSLADSAGSLSYRLDLGSTGRASLYKWIVRTKTSATMTPGKVLEVRLVTSDGTRADGNFSSVNQAVTDGNARQNAGLIGQVIADRATSGGDALIASGIVTIVDRYVQVMWWNSLGVSLTGLSTDHEFVLIPIVATVA
jgi:hypothetical protein